MALEVFNDYGKSKSVQEKCKCYLFYHVVLTMNDGSIIDGIIEEANDNNIKILVGEDMVPDNNMNRQPSGGNRFRRFRPRNYPANRINNVGLYPYPVPVPIYPIYPYPFFPFI